MFKFKYILYLLSAPWKYARHDPASAETLGLFYSIDIKKAEFAS